MNMNIEQTFYSPKTFFITQSLKHLSQSVLIEPEPNERDRPWNEAIIRYQVYIQVAHKNLSCQW